ncbi:MAG: TlpA family protein disulfide reductase [Magnetococcales bacterium]|nr:TlpA family protein disulfide reductase [Magnetococcales bacterium]
MKKFFVLIFILSCWLPVAGHTAWQGDAAPQFTLPSTTDKSTITLQSFKGQVVLIDFWASWCPPCRRSFPILDSLHKKYNSQGFVVIGVNEDNNINSGKEFTTNNPVHFPLVWDKKGKVARLYGLRGMPSSFLLDKQGVISYAWVGFPGGNHLKELENKIKVLLEAE